MSITRDLSIIALEEAIAIRRERAAGEKIRLRFIVFSLKPKKMREKKKNIVYLPLPLLSLSEKVQVDLAHVEREALG